ncbi:MAG TPA: MoaD/ThiS family protein [Burkholderiales bacterium]|nr:MoaD/ThiS family protein [Burkholderiales bacterium]
MARITLSSSLAPFTEGVLELELDVANVRQLFQTLGERYPELRPQLEAGIAVAIDGEIYQDALLQPIARDSEVILIPKIAGG